MESPKMKTETGTFDVYKHRKGEANSVLSGSFTGTITWKNDWAPAIELIGTWNNHEPGVPTSKLCVDESTLRPGTIYRLFFDFPACN